MPDMGAGSKLYSIATGVASASLSPQVPNAAVVRRILVGNQSANDTWVIRTNGQEVGRFFTPLDNDNYCLSGFTGAFNQNYDIFSYCHEVLGVDLIYPIPEGKTLTISSVGGATADIAFEYEEFTPSALTPSLVNYPGGNYWLNPVWFSVAASITTAGEHAIDTEVGLDFVPTLFIKESFPVGWTANILELFLEPLSTNLYASSTDHISGTSHLAAIRSGQRLFTRDPLSGIPLEATPATAGSVNHKATPMFLPSIAFDQVGSRTEKYLTTPINYKPGYVYDWRLGISGDPGAGADYSSAIQMAIVEYRGI